MKVLVTGAGGFIGSQVVQQLVAAGNDVAAIVRPGGSTTRLAQAGDRIKTITGDLARPEGWRDQVLAWRPDACIHTAWYAEPGVYLESPINLEAVRYSLDLLEVLGAAGCRSVVMAGTCFEYDFGSGAVLREDSPTRPRTLYAACKLALGIIAEQRARQLGIGLAWGRVFYVYGPFEDERRLVPALMLALLEGREFLASPGSLIRDYMHVTDVAGGLVAMATSGASGVFNICSSEPVTMKSLMTKIAEIAGRRELLKLGARPERENEPASISGDSRRLRETTGWTPRISLDDGLSTTYSWWQQVGGKARSRPA